MKNNQFDGCKRLKLDTGLSFRYVQMMDDIVTGKLAVNDESERHRWTFKLLEQGDVSDLNGTVHVVANHDMYSNIQGQISASQPNLQSVPKWTRNYLVSPPGRKLISLDIGAAEARAIVSVSGDAALEDAILNDPYVVLSDHIVNHTGILVPRGHTKRLFYGYLYGQTKWGVTWMLMDDKLIETLEEGEHVFNAIQGLFADASAFLEQIAASEKAFLQGQWTEVNVSGKSPSQRRSYVASSMVAALVKSWAANLVRRTSKIDVVEIPRDALWLSVPDYLDDDVVVALGRESLIEAIRQLGFDGFPTQDVKLLTMKKLGDIENG